MKDDKAHGLGKMIYKNGDIYEGEYLNGEQHGEGKIIFKCPETSFQQYDGFWKSGKYHGKGKYQFSNGDVYIG